VLKYRSISDLVKIFLLPEINKRINEGSINETELPYAINQVRVVQPNENATTIVELNEEATLITRIKLKRPMQVGEIVTLNDIYPEECFFITPCTHQDKPAAFWYYKSLYFDFYLAFDCTPNLPTEFFERIGQSKIKFPLLDLINYKRYAEVVKPNEKIKLLSLNNWPPAPAYHPHVFLEIHNNPRIINDDNFIEVVSNSYHIDYFKKRIGFWEETEFFPDRIQYIKRAIDAHFQEDYICSIHVLVPQFEGIIKDYLNKCEDRPPNGFSDCVRQLKQLVFSRKIVLFEKEVFDTVFSYLQTGSFWKNTNTIDDPSNIINRHGIAHGCFTGFECKGISLKYLILLDSLCYVLLHDKILTNSL